MPSSDNADDVTGEERVDDTESSPPVDEDDIIRFCCGVMDNSVDVDVFFDPIKEQLGYTIDERILYCTIDIDMDLAG